MYFEDCGTFEGPFEERSARLDQFHMFGKLASIPLLKLIKRKSEPIEMLVLLQFSKDDNRYQVLDLVTGQILV